jgi:hypothetical protein
MNQQSMFLPHVQSIAKLAYADDDALLFSGDGSTRDAKLAMKAAAEMLRAANWKITPDALTANDMKALLTCLSIEKPVSCVQEVMVPKHVGRAAIMSFEQERNNSNGNMIRVVTLRMLIPDSDAFPIDRKFCESTTDEMLVMTTKGLTAGLLTRAGAGSNRTGLKINSMPPGASVEIDDQAGGVTPTTNYTAPGKHRVKLSLGGFMIDQRQIEVPEGTITDLYVHLNVDNTPAKRPSVKGTPTAGVGSHAHEKAGDACDGHGQHSGHHGDKCDGDVDDPLDCAVSRGGSGPKGTSSSIAPLLLMGAGGVAIVGGGVLLALNEPSSVPRDQEQPKTYRSTIAPGVAMLAGGAVAVVGGYLWWRHSKSSSQPTVSVVSGGAIAGISGSF